MGGSLNIFLIGIIIILLVRSPCKILEPYENPLLDFSNGRCHEGYITVNAGYSPVHEGYIPVHAGRASKSYQCS